MPSVHFVAHHEREDAICRYRCLNFMDQLEASGWQAGFTFLFEPGNVRIGADVVVLNRVLCTPQIRRFALELKAQGRALVCGLDDLVFAEDWVEKAVAEADRWQADAIRREVEGYSGAIRETLLLSDCALVSTRYLAERVEGWGKPAYVLRNTVPAELWSLSRAVTSREPDAEVMLGYFSGTRTHNRDLASIGPPLARVLRANPSAVLTLVGSVEPPSELAELSERLRRLPMAPWRELPGLIGSVDINLAPLDLAFAFNQGKSHLKWLEAAAVGIPTVAADTAELRASVEDGVDGFLAASAEDWEEAMGTLIRDAAKRRSIGRLAYAKVESRFLGSLQSRDTETIFRDIAARFASGRSPGGGAVLKRIGIAEQAMKSLRRKGGAAMRAFKGKSK